MNLYLLKQQQNTGYDTYDSLVVAAEFEAEARAVGPVPDYWDYPGYIWADTLDGVEVTLLGPATPGTERGLILGSFNAG